MKLAARAREGDDASLETLVRASVPFAHAIARSRVGAGLVAEEVTIAALARAVRGIARLKRPEAYPRWLRRIVLRCAADVNRTQVHGAPLREPLPDPRPGPVETLLAVERGAAVRATIARLPAREREMVLLHYVEGLSYREIASATGAGLGTVARRMKRAHAVLRASLEVLR